MRKPPGEDSCPQDVSPANVRRSNNTWGEPCHTRIRKPDERTSVSATAGAPPTDSRGVCVPDAERFLPRRGAVCANPASRGTGRPDAPDTPKPERGEPHMVDATPRAAAAWRARGRGSAGASGWRPACARAADASPSRTAPSANPAVNRGGRPRGSSTPKGAPGGAAADAEQRFSRGLRRALHAPRAMRRAHRKRTPPAGSAITTGEPSDFASTAVPMRTQG